jgi:uncharacterized protein with WD repeat
LHKLQQHQRLLKVSVYDFVYQPNSTSFGGVEPSTTKARVFDARAADVKMFH